MFLRDGAGGSESLNGANSGTDESLANMLRPFFNAGRLSSCVAEGPASSSVVVVMAMNVDVCVKRESNNDTHYRGNISEGRRHSSTHHSAHNHFIRCIHYPYSLLPRHVFEGFSFSFLMRTSCQTVTYNQRLTELFDLHLRIMYPVRKEGIFIFIRCHFELETPTYLSLYSPLLLSSQRPVQIHDTAWILPVSDSTGQSRMEIPHPSLSPQV
jgi:hypothetical protein